ncbi:FAD-dependent monooxygenase [Streptomyces sp. NBC_00445]|uniref:FAD-dependent monooxygenase n=1 Tax=Streptomyces sp. NBC_00445 TaxID=2975745 RepID=UPI002E1FC3B0
MTDKAPDIRVLVVGAGPTGLLLAAELAQAGVPTTLVERRPYWERGAWHDVSGDEVNAYLEEMSGLDISAKDFRTWHATVMAAVALAVSQPVARSETARRRAIARAVREVSRYLGNTPAVCRASYINPRVIELYEEGVTIADALPHLGEEAADGIPATHGLPERAVVRMLRNEERL